MVFEYAVGQNIAGTRYRVTMHIASGGMGAVYEVEEETLGRRFAVKILRGALAGDRAAEQRMILEAKTLGQLDHPNVVQVFTAGVTTDALRLPFIVMQRLSGCSLRELLRERPRGLGMRATTLIAVALLDALDEAHDKELIHRDIKPGNVFLHRDRRGHRVTKLLDFGLAEFPCVVNDEPTKFAGTVRYASPEQLAAGAEVSLKSDLYSMGLVVYEMLAGYHVFHEAKDSAELMRAHLETVPRMPPSWPASVRSLVGSALEKNPERRPRDAFTFASRLREAAKGLGVDVRPPLLDEELLETGDAVGHAGHDGSADTTMLGRSADTQLDGPRDHGAGEVTQSSEGGDSWGSSRRR